MQELSLQDGILLGLSGPLGASWNIVASAKSCFVQGLLLFCLLPFSRYNCNRYDEDEARAARDSQEKSRSALQRYLFYCNRYMNHMQSLRLEHKHYSTVKEKMEEMQQHNMSWIEVRSHCILIFLALRLTFLSFF